MPVIEKSPLHKCEVCGRRVADYRVKHVKDEPRFIHSCAHCLLKDKDFWSKYEALITSTSRTNN